VKESVAEAGDHLIAGDLPGRQVAGILAHMLAELGGMIHCVTQQQSHVPSRMIS
jgi:agmatine/peptidylarginine deiminase